LRKLIAQLRAVERTVWDWQRRPRRVRFASQEYFGIQPVRDVPAGSSTPVSTVLERAVIDLIETEDRECEQATV
jgi:hypothetical protein